MKCDRQGLTVSVPWSIRLCGDAQEDLGLPVICAALDLRTAIRAKPRDDGLYSVSARELSSPVVFNPHSESDFPKSIPSLGRVIGVLQADTLSLKRGCDFELFTRVPGQEDILESPALVVAWIVMLLALEDRVKDASANRIMGLGCAAFAGEDGCGSAFADVCTCVFGGTLVVRAAGKPEVLQIENRLSGLVLGYPRRRAKQVCDLSQLLCDTRQAVERMRKLFSAFSLAETPFDEAVARLGELSERDAEILYAQIRNRDLCKEARLMMDSECGLDDDRIGEMFDGLREIFSHYLAHRSREMERLVEAALKAGALGCKLNSGGTSLLAFAPGCEEKVIAAIAQAGGEAHGAALADGMSIDA